MNTERLPLTDEGPTARFSEKFWGKDDAGYSALTTRMRHAKLTCQEILGMFQARAALEEEYGKKLLKLSKSPLGKDELGSLRDSLDVVRYEIEATGKSHVELAGKMRDQLELALAEFNNGQKDMRKLAKEKYETECTRTKGLSAAKLTLVGKELDKVSMKMEKTELASRAADIEYQESIRQLTEINDKWILEWRAACDKFQLLEEERIDYLRTTLWNYANIISSTCVADDESCERIRFSLELCDVGQNLQTFIEAFATGEDVPDIPLYLGKISDSMPSASPTSESNSSEIRVKTVSGPHQPLPSGESSAPSSRRQSVYSTTTTATDVTDSTAITATTTNPALSGQVDMALTIGTNVFKLDPQTTALLNQVDDPAGVGTNGGYVTPKSANGENRSPSSSQRQQPSPVRLQEENSLGISLDASGSVKENRFPQYQSQVPLQPQPSPGYMMGHTSPFRSQQQQQQHTPNNGPYHPAAGNGGGRMGSPGVGTGGALAGGGLGPNGGGGLVAGAPYSVGGPGSTMVHSRSQTMPVQGSGPATQPLRQSSGPFTPVSVVDPAVKAAAVAAGQISNLPYRPIPVTSHLHNFAGSSHITRDGRLVLFFVRAVYDYDATIPEELSLKIGDILAVIHAREDGWWEGDLVDEYNPKRGLFPSNFTEPTM
ncbi:Proline-serine-threonine phosphatase-interacting protein 2 [Dissophora globulifera]|uniref:Proline-serine-threonine phosphatase-interacting protein 2 n=1 Tax=Dissophora globulifera TaxID=979702 RepID=A0A9P6RST6_9FUNG|nr:Proline-serine-threonine phosphatase-interacting protein 2 [Dissophora globulifera]